MTRRDDKISLKRIMSPNQYFVYIMTNASKTLYTGVTGNLERRVWEHKNKTAPGFTSKYNITKLVFFESFGDVHEAIAAEKKIKGWTRKKKIDLIEKNNPEWIDLSADWFDDTE